MRSMIDTILLQSYYDRRDRTEMVNLGTEPSQWNHMQKRTKSCFLKEEFITVSTDLCILKRFWFE